MTDKRQGRTPFMHEAIRTPEEVHRRLARLERLNKADAAQRGYVKLIFDVLAGIACGSIKEPSSTAAAVLSGIDRNTLITRTNSHVAQNTHAGSVQDQAPPSGPASFGIVNRASIVESLIKQAERAADTTPVDQTAMDFLYSHSRFNCMPKPDWEAAVRIACTIELMPRGHQRGLLLSDFVESEIATAEFQKVKSWKEPSRGTLLLTFHGAFVIIARRLFSKACEDGLIFGKNGTMRGRVPTTDTHRDALFASLRILQGGGAILMAPDGQEGRRTAQLTVLGTTAMAGEGAAFLAHASGCNTAWYTVVRDGYRFVPIIEQGPRRENAESFEKFAARLYRFYADKIEAVFTGHPSNILLRPMWSKLFKEKLLQAR